MAASSARRNPSVPRALGRRPGAACEGDGPVCPRFSSDARILSDPGPPPKRGRGHHRDRCRPRRLEPRQRSGPSFSRGAAPRTRPDLRSVAAPAGGALGQRAVLARPSESGSLRPAKHDSSGMREVFVDASCGRGIVDQFGGEAVAPDRLCSQRRLALSSALGLDHSLVSDFDLPISAMNRRRHRRAVAELVNRERRSHGLGRLRYAQSLRISAHAWALAITRSSRFTHGAFAKRALRFPFVLRSRGRRWKVGENLAWGIGEVFDPAEHRGGLDGVRRAPQEHPRRVDLRRGLDAARRAAARPPAQRRHGRAALRPSRLKGAAKGRTAFASDALLDELGQDRGLALLDLVAAMSLEARTSPARRSRCPP